ncbi:hypothetical protein GCM10009839_22150 [Catenulispora yoronensis]|uniref:Protein kinase domain-containing protein n=1 Tax=Catenulispora yoronensis TaxID=450799 RepID=A0ABP5FHJ3_9ACTN
MEPLSDDDPRRIGRYDLLGRIGAGGMGRVYLGRSASGRQVAIKVIHHTLVESPEFRTRFAREIAAARAVGGFYTAAVVDADPDAEQPWLATEYVPGPSLDQAVREHGPLSGDPLRVLAVGLAEALAAIHAAGVVHRDFKPSNVVLAADGPRVIDFGIARAFDATALTSAQQILGTPGFMAPEQLQDGTVTAAADVFCLGMTLAYASTGRPPFGTGGLLELSYRVVNNEPDLDGVPTALAGVVESCLAKDPARRPGIRQVLDALTGTSPGPAPMPIHPPVSIQPPVPVPVPVPVPATMSGYLPTPNSPTNGTPPSGPKRSAVPMVVSSMAVLAIAAGVGIWYLSSGNKDPDTSSVSGAPTTHSTGTSTSLLPDSQTPATSPASPSTSPSSSAPSQIVVGSLNFPESALLAEIYAQALTAKGLTVTKKLNLGAREVAYNALRSGMVSVIPEYNGALLAYLQPGATAKTTDDIDAAVIAKLPAELELLNAAPAQDNDSLVVTQTTASKFGLAAIADLASQAPQLVLGGAPDFQTRPSGLPALQGAYGLHFKSFQSLDYGGPISVSALNQGRVQVVDLFTSDPAIVQNHLVVLADGKNVFGSQNVIPLAVKSALPQAGADALNAVSAKLTTAELGQLNEQVSVENKAPADVAHAWLVKSGLA